MQNSLVKWQLLADLRYVHAFLRQRDAAVFLYFFLRLKRRTSMERFSCMNGSFAGLSGRFPSE